LNDVARAGYVHPSQVLLCTRVLRVSVLNLTTTEKFIPHVVHCR